MTEDQSRPLVTLALVAYNQEKYIHEAIKAALAQDYNPLEIIISDDCSTDRTFELIKEVMTGYQGHHKVIIRQSDANRGLLLHMTEVAALATGQMFVVAAGDDVSKRSRVSALAAVWAETGAWGLCSRYDLIDGSGQVKAQSIIAPVLQGDGLKCYLDEAEGPVSIVHGCTSAYDMRVFKFLKLKSDDYILAEDGALTILINLLGKKIVHLNESLVMYRESDESLTNSRKKKHPSLADLVLDEGRIERLARAQANRCRLFLRMDETLGSHQVRRLHVDKVRQELAIQEAKAKWWGLSFGEKVAFLSTHVGAKWALARIFGFRSFLLSKWLFRRISFTNE